MALNIGSTIGDYQVVGILGAGGMGKVYKVRNVISDRIEAMKVLLPDLANEPELADRFIREIKLLASLNHPNIAALHTAMRIENQLLMVMEYVEGRNLEDRLKEGPLPPGEAINYVAQALSALQFAHDRGVVHRDIKPANIMVTPAGEVKLMDFGIAKAMADRRLTMTGTTLGSLFYMSPEQVKGSTSIDGRSDLYSIGVTLYELVTGTRPFKGDSDYSLMVAHLQQQPVPPIQLDPSLPQALNDVILTAIQKDPGLRFQTAQAFRGALESMGAETAPAQAGRPFVPAPPPAEAPAPPPPPQAFVPPPPPQPQFQPPPPAAMPPQPPPSSGGHRGLWMAAGGLVVLVVLGLAVWQVPKWYKARAGGDEKQTSTTIETPAPTPTPTEQATPAPPEATPAATPATAEATPTPTAVPSQGGVTPATSPRRTAPESRRLTSGQPAAPGGQPAVASQTPAVQAHQAPAVDTVALEKARERLGNLAPHANAVRDGLKNLESEQKADGLALRGDIKASWQRMEYLLDQAEAALNSGDPVKAKKQMDLAEAELDKLERFLGR